MKPITLMCPFANRVSALDSFSVVVVLERSVEAVVVVSSASVVEVVVCGAASVVDVEVVCTGAAVVMVVEGRRVVASPPSP